MPRAGRFSRRSPTASASTGATVYRSAPITLRVVPESYAAGVDLPTRPIEIRYHFLFGQNLTLPALPPTPRLPRSREKPVPDRRSLDPSAD